jgi:phosphoglycerol transferase MdoB-like AlkP superfamily enzyme
MITVALGLVALVLLLVAYRTKSNSLSPIIFLLGAGLLVVTIGLVFICSVTVGVIPCH